MLQNRVDPYGQIIRTPARGSWTGNRGVIHNASQEIVRLFKLKAWITCKLEYKERWRKVMTPNRWTELFFLDEATAVSAGHRPCGECRYEDYKKFKMAWIKGNPEFGFDGKTSIRLIDAVLHEERIKRTFPGKETEQSTAGIPDGVFIQKNNEPFLVYKNHIHRWTPFGYEDSLPVHAKMIFCFITPPTMINTIKVGYIPQVASEKFYAREIS